MKIKVNEATKIQIDWLVAKCEGWEYDDVANAARDDRTKKYSTKWAQGGPIIEREGITTAPFYREWVAAPSVSELITDQDGDRMTVVMWDSEPHSYGPTPLVAAMRCYVSSKLGEEVEVSDELV